jgi:hypothetical protein
MGVRDCHCFGGCAGFTRVILMAINIFFLGAGVLIVILGSVAIGKAAQFESESDLFRNMDTKVSCAILIATGAGTIATAIVGFVGVTFRWQTTLKLYTVIMFLVCTLQLAMGIFLYTRDPQKIEGDLWFDPTYPQGVITRVAYQNYLGCCGWEHTLDTRTDAWGPTDCPIGYIPGWELGDTEATPPCLTATIAWKKQYMYPIAQAAIVLAVFQFVALSGSCFIIMVAKKDGDDFYSSPYHY